MKPSTARFILCKLWGWKIDDRPIADPKCVILGFPHTCIADYFVYALYIRSLGETPTVMVKAEFFRWPIKHFLNKWGAIRTDRSRGAGAIKHCLDEFAKRDTLHLSLSPEGTRKPVKKWKTGFHTIAKMAEVPVYLGYYDWDHRYITHGDPFDITDDAQADLRRIQSFYRHSPASAKYKEKVAFLDDLD